MGTTTGPPSNYNDIRAGIVELLEADRGLPLAGMSIRLRPGVYWDIELRI
jgi:hypothetical protein